MLQLVEQIPTTAVVPPPSLITPLPSNAKDAALLTVMATRSPVLASTLVTQFARILSWASNRGVLSATTS